MAHGTRAMATKKPRMNEQAGVFKIKI